MSFEEFYDEFNEGRDTVDDITKMLNEDAADEREKRIQKRKRNLKYTVCSLFGLAVGFFSNSVIEYLLFLFLFSAYILLSD
jgi:hypothetical protein